MSGEDAVPDGAEATIRTTETDLDEVGRILQRWLGARLGSPEEPRVRNLARPEHSGMSSISVLFDADWVDADGVEHSAELVARLAPEASAFPVFPGYDLQLQFDVMRAVAAGTDVPVPRVRWVEVSPDVLGTPFLVMDRVKGVVAVDNPPYVFGGWLYDMEPNDRRAVQEAAIRMMAETHAVTDPFAVSPSWDSMDGAESLRRHVDNERAYYEWTRREDRMRIPLLERGFDWLEEHWPAQPSPAVLCWGDSRVGNIMYEGTDPVAVLDWESAAPAPREVDLAWFIFFHRMFQDIAEMFDMPGLPDMFRRADVVAHYESASGVTVGDLDFYLVYAALRHGIVMSQIDRRRIHFGEIEAHDDPDHYILHHPMLSALLDGTYDWEK